MTRRVLHFTSPANAAQRNGNGAPNALIVCRQEGQQTCSPPKRPLPRLEERSLVCHPRPVPPSRV